MLTICTQPFGQAGIYLKMQAFWRDTPCRFVNSTEILQALKTLFVFSPITYTLGKCGIVRADVEMLHLVALYPHLTL